MSIAAIAIGLGPCTSPGLPLGFCTNVLVALNTPGPLVFFFGPPPAPPPSCNATRKLLLPIPVSKNLCNFQISFQWVVGCKGTPAGNGMTNCQTLRITGI
jgi:hypothetical protein